MHPEGDPLKGVALVMAATLLFAAGDTLGKHLSMLYAAPLILSARYLINLVLVLATMWPRHRSAVWRTRRSGLVLLRGLLLALATSTMLLALRVMPVAETVAIIYITPVLVMLASGPVLGEKVSPLGWLCAALGFAGVLLIARPGSGLDPWGVALCLLNAVLGSGYHLLTRVLTRTETTMALLFHTALVGSVLSQLMLSRLIVQTPASSAGIASWNRPSKPSVRASAATVSSVTGWPCGTPVTPASEPDSGIGVCSSAQGTSSVAVWFIPAWVASDSGTLSHFSAGKVLQACTNLPPQMPAQDRPEIRKNTSTRLSQVPSTPCSDFQNARPLADRSGTSMDRSPRPRGQAM